MQELPLLVLQNTNHSKSPNSLVINDGNILSRLFHKSIIISLTLVNMYNVVRVNFFFFFFFVSQVSISGFRKLAGHVYFDIFRFYTRYTRPLQAFCFKQTMTTCVGSRI